MYIIQICQQIPGTFFSASYPPKYKSVMSCFDYDNYLVSLNKKIYLSQPIMKIYMLINLATFA